MELEKNSELGSSMARIRNSTGHSMTSLQKISLAITGTMEKFFYRWGFIVATYPYRFIIGCLCCTALCGLGLLNFTLENRPDKLWIPRDSSFAYNTEWLRDNFPSPVRQSHVIITADNVLDPGIMKMLLEIHENVKNISVSDNKRWEDICFRLPITKFDLERRRRRRRSPTNSSRHEYDAFFGSAFEGFDEFDSDFFTSDASTNKEEDGKGFDPMLSLPEDIYCSIIDNLDDACWEINPLELWSYNRTKIENLTQDEIIKVFNTRLISPIFGRVVNYTADLGGKIERNSLGQIIKAESIALKWFVAINQSEVRAGRAVPDMGTGEVADETGLAWETEFIYLMDRITKKMPDGINLYFATGRSFGDISQGLIFDDGLMLVAGFFIMFVYVSTMLGKFNLVEQRPYLSIAGISCVALSVVISYGVGSACFLVYGPVNKILPFLLLGIGVDDMFVIMQCWNNLFPDCLTKPSKLSIPERMGMALKHAGVSITITSLTDIAAFGVGASTILPGLQSFCIYAAIGILAVFLLQTTFFVGWFAIDQKRVEERRNAYFCCIKYRDDEFIPSKFSQRSYAQIFFDEFFSKYLFTPVAKTIVITITLGCLATTIYGNTKLRQEFDPIWFLPEDSHLSQFLEKREVKYPGIGFPGFVVAHQVNWTASFPQMEQFMHDFQESTNVYQFENWYEDFKEYSNKNLGTKIPEKYLAPSKFKRNMGKFLYSPAGSKHRAYFKVAGNFSCGDKLPPVQMVLMPFRFKYFHGPEEHIPGMHAVKALVKNANLTFNENTDGNMFAWSTGFVTWESDELITAELYRSVALSLACVLITIFFLLANLRMCLLCGVCVIFTIINVGGFMFFWGLTINMVSCIDIVLAIGLCVDYASHIGLAFMTCSGSRNSRAKQALRNIGPAVLNGGFSTFISISLLARSQSLAFISFYKIFTIVVGFGLFHGLIFLPVILSILGPDPYPNAFNSSTEYHFDEKGKTVEMQAITNRSIKLEKRSPDDNSINGESLPVHDPLIFDAAIA
ncbi:unnamed protein product [Orchesella dallaii]|uniref:SSD domain-containing protein n=1 Tax=Orchesella dallaii TaxID=48710 RepID=A0ABP1QVE1_9HEXA